MKVLMFGWEFPPHISGGLGTACHGIATGLAGNGVDILFVVPKVKGNEDAKNITLVNASDVIMPEVPHQTTILKESLAYFEVNCPIVPYLSPEEFSKHSTNTTDTGAVAGMRYSFTGGYGKDLMKEVWQYALTAMEIARNNEVDIIHAHDWLSFPAGIMAKEISGKPLVAHMHATEFDRSGDDINMQVYETERQGMLKADKVIAVSEFTRNTIIQKYYIPAEKVVTIHNAAPEMMKGTTGQTAGLFREKIVSYIGRITYQKGPAYFIEAAAKILKKDKNFRFIMAGSGDLLQAMIMQAAHLGISSHFHFTGFLKGPERDYILSLSDVYVMPSVSEPFGISPLEAISAGVPVVISKQSGVQEVLQYALKTDWWDVNALANSIYGLARYKGLSAMLRRESAKEAGELKWESQALLIHKLYHNILNNA